MGLKVQDKKGSSTVSVSAGHKATSVTEEVESVAKDAGKFTQPTANVGVNCNYTKNLGNYESVKIGVSLNLPCYVEEIDDIHEFASEWVSKKMEMEIDKINNMLEE